MASSDLVCVTPAAGVPSAVDIITVTGGKEIARRRLDASGDQRPVARDGCSGWERAHWSDDKRRIFVRSELSCPGGLARASTGILAITPQGEWLDVEGVSAGGGGVVRVNRYRSVTAPSSLGSEIVSAVASRETEVSTARIAAGATIGPAEVAEAARNVEPSVLQAFLVERGQPFTVDAKTLVSLANAGVAGQVTDVMVALAYPRTFVVNGGTRGIALVNDSTRSASGYGARVPAYAGRSACSVLGYGYDPYWYGTGLSYGIPWMGYSPYTTGCGLYGYNRYGYYPYGYGIYGYGGRFVNPYVIVRLGAGPPRGQALNGRGYTRPSGAGVSTGRTAMPRLGGVSARGFGGASTRSGGSHGSGRTAVRRP